MEWRPTGGAESWPVSRWRAGSSGQDAKGAASVVLPGWRLRRRHLACTGLECNAASWAATRAVAGVLVAEGGRGCVRLERQCKGRRLPCSAPGAVATLLQHQIDVTLFTEVSIFPSKKKGEGEGWQLMSMEARSVLGSRPASSSTPAAYSSQIWDSYLV